VEFEWDSAKAKRNLRKHSVSFEFASRVFLDPDRIEGFDDCDDYGEERWRAIGLVGPALLFVVYTVVDDDDEVVRLISARKANANERAEYGEIHA
jgi:uncharacterized DUF497 family protein